MLIAWSNKADAAVVAAGSELATLPGSNVQQEHVAQKWRTGPMTTSYLLFDLLASVSCSVLAVLGTNLTSAGTLRLRASDADPTAVAGDLYDSGTVAAGVKAGYGAAYKAFAAVAARYWRLDLTDATVSYIEAGRVFLGPSWTPTYGQNFGWSVVSEDASRRARSYGGQTWVDELPQERVLQFTLAFLDEAEMYGNAFALARANGTARDVLAIHDTAGSYLSEQAVFGLVARAEPIVHELPRIYRTKYEIRERL